MAWLWGRIYPRVKSRRGAHEELGYLNGGFKIFFDRLREEIVEFEATHAKTPEEYDELLDIINVACMLAARISK